MLLLVLRIAAVRTAFEYEQDEFRCDAREGMTFCVLGFFSSLDAAEPPSGQGQ